LVLEVRSGKGQDFPAGCAPDMVENIVRFGSFEFDLARRELRRNGMRVPLQRKPFRVLELLLQRPGELVSREELIHHLWPDSHVSFEHGLNTAVNALRHALGESSRSAIYIETRSGEGYVFVASIQQVKGGAVQETPELERRAGQEDCAKGRYLLDRFTSDDTYKAVAFFHSAIADDQSLAAAHAGLADAHCRLALLTGRSSEHLHQQARQGAEAALRLDAKSEEALLAAARVQLIFDWNWIGCDEHIQRALAVNCRSAEAYTLQSCCLLARGLGEQAYVSAQAAARLAPLSPGAKLQLIRTSMATGDFSLAVRECWDLVNLNPALGYAQLLLGQAYEQVGCFDEACDQFRSAQSFRDLELPAAYSLVHTLRKTGRKNDAEEVKAEYMARDAAVSGKYPYGEALLALADNAYQEAHTILQRCVEVRDPAMLCFQADARWKEARNLPLFRSLADAYSALQPRGIWRQVVALSLCGSGSD
jgi:DNA-binding winged helix-turn-helix (wHTH) protein